MTTLTITPDQTEFTSEQKHALQAVIVGKPSSAELAQFLHICQVKNLDPFQRDIYLISRGGKANFQVGVEGLRKIANRWAAENGYLLGNKPPRYYDTDGKAWPFPCPKLAAVEWTITIDGPNGLHSERTAVVQMSDYNQGSGLWKSKSAVMLAKVAETVALRQAAPEATSGVYSHEEMPAFEGPAKTGRPIPVRDAKRKLLMFLTEAGLDDDAAKRTAIGVWSEHGSPTKPLSQSALDEMLNTAHNSISTVMSNADPFPGSEVGGAVKEEGPFALDDETVDA